MLLKNISKRLITVNTTGGDGKNIAVKILPGDNPPVEIDNDVAKNAFVKALIKDGSLVPGDAYVDEDEPETDASDLSKKTKDELLVIAQMIDPNAKGTKADLIKIINGETE